MSLDDNIGGCIEIIDQRPQALQSALAPDKKFNQLALFFNNINYLPKSRAFGAHHKSPAFRHTYYHHISLKQTPTTNIMGEETDPKKMKGM